MKDIILRLITIIAALSFGISSSMLDSDYWFTSLVVVVISFGWLMLFAYANTIEE